MPLTDNNCFAMTNGVEPRISIFVSQVVCVEGKLAPLLKMLLNHTHITRQTSVPCAHISPKHLGKSSQKPHPEDAHKVFQ